MNGVDLQAARKIAANVPDPELPYLTLNSRSPCVTHIQRLSGTGCDRTVSG